MKFNQAVVVFLMLQVVTVGAFFLPSSKQQQQPRFVATTTTRLASTSSSTPSSSSSSSSSSSVGSTEVERLLAKAAALRAEAEKAEHQVHSKEATKKKQHDDEMDRRIDYLFSADGGKSKMKVAQQLKNKRYCIDTLKDIVTRLHERELIASGKEHVDHDVHDDRTDVQRVSDEVDEAELLKLDGLIDCLIGAVGVLDAELKADKEKTGKIHVNHIEDEHFGGLDSAKRLEQYYHEIRREHEEQYQKRQEEFFEAQRIKEGNKPPPKQKDHMMHP